MASVTTIDCHYVHPQFAAAYLIEDGGRAVFVDNNTALAVPILLRALAAQGLSPAEVDYLIVTHVHLDHAGGTSALLRSCPHAQVLAHPRAARHLIDPEKLVAGAKAVYGDAKFLELYGEIDPIPSSRVREVGDGERLRWQGREFEFLHTAGHAKHHICIVDAASEGIFTGDTFGLAYPALQKRGFFILPSTSPTDFEPEPAKASVERVLATGAKRAYLTHFGEIQNLGEAASDLLRHLEFSEALMIEASRRTESDEARKAFCYARLGAYIDAFLMLRFGSDAEPRSFIELDLELNAAGIAYSARKLITSYNPG